MHHIRAFGGYLLIAVAVVGVASCLASGVPAPAVVQPAPATPTPAEVFKQEYELGQRTKERGERFAHWDKAIAAYPDHPDRIMLEYRTAVSLHQRRDKSRGIVPKPKEAYARYRRIVENYNHLDYYKTRPGEETWGTQLMVARAAMQAGGMACFVFRDAETARTYLLKAMESIGQTQQRRTMDWLGAPEPQPWTPPHESAKLLGTARAEKKYRHLLAEWRQRREAAGRGEVLGKFETRIAEITVRHFGGTFGRQRPFEVARAMGIIIRKFPGTAVAKIAQQHVDKAGELTKAELDKYLATLPPDLMATAPADGVETPTATAPATRPATSQPSPPSQAAYTDDADDEADALTWLALGAALLIAVALGGPVVHRRRRTIRTG